MLGPEIIITVLDKDPVRVFRTIIGPERARNSHVFHEALHDGKNGGHAFGPSVIWALGVEGAVNEHDHIPQALE